MYTTINAIMLHFYTLIVLFNFLYGKQIFFVTFSDQVL